MLAVIGAAVYILRPEATPYNLDGLKPLRWHSLLNRDPKLVFPKDDPAQEFYPDNSAQQLMVTAPSTFLLGLGETNSNNYRVESALTNVDQTASVGIFLGLQPSPTAEEPLRWEFQVILLEYDQPSIMCVRRLPLPLSRHSRKTARTVGKN